MPLLESYIVPVRRTTRDRFVSGNANPFLLCLLERPSDDKQWSFRTKTITSARISIANLMASEGIVVSNELLKYDVLPVVKASGSPWRNRVSLGRARNNDIVLVDTSISKLHGHIAVAKDGTMTFTDAGSRNGTQVNGTKIASGETATVASGDKLTFGAVETLLLDAGAFYDFIAKRIQAVDK
jgi:pSer/pThr/pTyr-binding forkhead associated (FHA) protein